MSNKSGTLYVGMTNNLVRRAHDHKSGTGSGFTSRYRLTRLLYYEETNDVQGALNREKRIKKWRRSKKLDLIRALNPQFVDLSEEWDTATGL